MLMPNVFRDDLLDGFFDFSSDRYNTSSLMNMDIRDTDNGYEATVNVPEVKKEDIKAELRDRYLTIWASTDSNKEEKDSNGRYIRRERHSGPYSRSFYVRGAITQEGIKAKFGDGALKLLTPEKETVPEVEKRGYIAIEG